MQKQTISSILYLSHSEFIYFLLNTPLGKHIEMEPIYATLYTNRARECTRQSFNALVSRTHIHTVQCKVCALAKNVSREICFSFALYHLTLVAA